MRNAFAAELVEAATRDERVVALSGDIGNRLFDPFKDRFPDRFLNCGVAEANMTGVAAGLALAGLRPVTYTIAPFGSYRCLEQIRVDVCYHDLPVVIVGVGGGLSYANLGATHQACEDVAVLRSLPNMTVVCPGDPWEARRALQAAIGLGQPVYIRLGKKGEPDVERPTDEFDLGKGIVLRPGSIVSLLATGTVLPIALAAADLLEKRGISTQVVSLHTVKPIDQELLDRNFESFRVVATVEEHSVIGGLGSAVAEWLADNEPRNARLVRLGTDDRFLHEAGGQSHARTRFGLTPAAIAETVARTLDLRAREPGKGPQACA